MEADDREDDDARAPSVGVQAPDVPLPDELLQAADALTKACANLGGVFVLAVEFGPGIWSTSNGTYGRTFGLIEYVRESTRFNLHRSLSRTYRDETLPASADDAGDETGKGSDE